MTSAINELFEYCPSCEMPLSQYQFYIETQMERGKTVLDIFSEMGIECMGCKTHIINKPMTTVMDYTRDARVVMTSEVSSRERGYVVSPNLSTRPNLL